MLSSHRPSAPRTPNAHGLRAAVLRNSTTKSPSPLGNRRSKTGEGENAGASTRQHEQKTQGTQARKTNKPPLQRKLSPFPGSLAGKLTSFQQRQQSVGSLASLDEGQEADQTHVSRARKEPLADSSMLVPPQRPNTPTSPRSRREMLLAARQQQQQQGRPSTAPKSTRFTPQMSAIHEDATLTGKEHNAKE